MAEAPRENAEDLSKHTVMFRFRGVSPIQIFEFVEILPRFLEVLIFQGKSMEISSKWWMFACHDAR